MIRISAPGRICLFGEHQDYLRLPVITAAIGLRVVISGKPGKEKLLKIDLPDIGSSEELDISSGKELEYTKDRDYFRSVYNVLKRSGLELNTGYDCTVRGSIPINSGTSSSSALNNVWCRFLIEAGEGIETDLRGTGRFSYLAEVEEFGEPGGMMDQYATALGGIQFMDFSSGVSIEELGHEPGAFVLGDSGEPKDTMFILSNVKDKVLSAVKKIERTDPSFDLFTYPCGSVSEFRNIISGREYEVLEGALMNRDMTFMALKMLRSSSFDRKELGALLTQHHTVLNEKLVISTPKIERMISDSLKAGAFGAKINGSGGGGCMFAYAPERPEKVAEAIENAGGKAYIVKVSDGLKIENVSSI